MTEPIASTSKAATTSPGVPETIFKNPLKLPLEKLYLKRKTPKGTELEIKAIDHLWISRQYYPCFCSVPENDDPEETSRWLSRANNFIKALSFVDSMPSYRFWSYIMYEPRVPAMLDSFLNSAVPCYMPQPTGEFKEPYEVIYDLVYGIYKKIFTPKHSETEFITPKVLGKLLKDNKVVTNYVLWDICKVYGHTDDGTIADILKFVYTEIPSLKDELVNTVICMAEIFEAIGTAAYENDSPTEKSVTDLTYLLYDTAFSINMFMKLYPPFQEISVNENLFSRIVHTYDAEIPLLYHLMKSVYIDDKNPGYDRVDNARAELLETCHHLFIYCTDKIIETQGKDTQQKVWIDKYFNLITSSVGQTEFCGDYDRVFSVSQSIETVMAICPNIDKEKCNSILNTLKKNRKEEAKASKREIKFAEIPKVVQPSATAKVENGLDEATVPDHILLESKITEVLDVLPHLGDGFVERCLQAMDMDTARVTMAILEGNLPRELAELDQNLPRIPVEVDEPGPPVQAAYVGKKPDEHKNLAELLNDKTHIKQQKERFDQYSLSYMYDDDYDDGMYTDSVTFSMEPDEIENVGSNRRRGFNRRVGFGNRVLEDHELEPEDRVVNDDDEYEEEEEGTQPPKDAFCQDPALLRARREAKFQQSQPQRKQKPNKNKDVVGNPKGQGQEKSVQNNRENKNVHKSSRANHNRRAGASWKRSRGMIPS